ncbi:hypothetical protein PVK06_037042 [Gossypium arboreum]|uniref:RNase H type-1 domain-containing protein n=1 Tax=Gossypium arboreum TaxID=29729 RepID=A0ABR0MWA1_GOSAR|nr:hypothetical protein PVK06_037042 [Gossypium arboreum]
MTKEGFCPRCGEFSETTLQTVRDCHFAKGVWRTILPAASWNLFFTTSGDVWLQWNLKNEGYIVMVEGRYRALADTERGVGQTEYRLLFHMSHTSCRGFHQVDVESDNVGLIELICNSYAADNKLLVLLPLVRAL